ncbi:receptor-type tyrosine-protein phosphatase H isoform X2 [Seriola lalandi dorsalis]|uniref:receptor-type tyrosine-protein phosphatase H isoform X2 n=1 Tax=Seriola lalandi dorsalis TaxID=1841481 RepID=UPI000C6FC3F2|nr:receptor-type tyrosine-protein phosphatase H isoform X2 [Seriola lalandi dorsalis]
MMKPLSFKITSNHLLLCVFLGRVWSVTDSNTPSIPNTRLTSTVTHTTGAETSTLLTTPMTSLATTRKRPDNVEDVTVLNRTETSITLTWDKVDNILIYILQYDSNGMVNKNINASDQGTSVEYVVSSLTAGTIYNFTLFTVSEGLNSTGYTFEAVTAPRNADGFKSVNQSESSITLQWEKVDNILNYTLKFNEAEENVTASEGQEPVKHTISGLTSGTEYNFILYTVLREIKSSGVNLTAFTVPDSVKDVTVLNRTETSITLMWDKVDNITRYVLQYDSNGSTEKQYINASDQGTSVEHVVSSLTAGTIYRFTLFAVFEGLNSTGYTFEAVTAPRNADGFKSVNQSESSITLQWEKVDNILNYTLKFNEGEKDVTASEGQEPVKHTISGLTSGTEYNFILYTVLREIKSSGVNLTAFTVPDSIKNVTVLNQTETSITLMWHKVKSISRYFLQYDNKGSTEKQYINASDQGTSVEHVVSSLNAGKKYHFTLFTVIEGLNSTGYTFEAVTVPPMVSSVNVTERSVTSFTLTWDNGDKDWTYLLQINGSNSTITPDANAVSHSVKSLKPGTDYPFSVITMFSKLKSIPYKCYTVTAIDCTSVTWHVTNSSIQGMVEGLFSNATASNEHTHVSPEGSNVSFTGLYPGATYEVLLVYKRHSTDFEQCRHKLTILPPSLSARCDYWDAGYSIIIVWNKPEGVVTEVEVNVTGQSHKALATEEHKIKISGFQPAKIYEVSLSSLSGTVRSYEPFVFLCSTDPRGVIAGSVFAVLLFVVLVCLAVFILFKRPDLIRKKAFIGVSKKSDKKCKAISVAKFPDHFCQLSVDDNRGFSQEYENLVPVGTDQTRKAAILPENKARNRFNNVLPYDWCRVKLSTSNPDETSDYINASYMPGYNREREYIATQGPLPSTVSDFWRMIWEQRVKGIVMVTNCVEGGRTKCERYWPADSKPCLYGEFLITMKSEQQEPNWTLREFSVKHTNTSEGRTVKHFHFTAWPDHGVPQGTDVLIQFRRLVRWHIEREGNGAPTVVHCSAGVGRTGTIIALDVLLQQLDKKRTVGINAFVHRMRLCRPFMVQTESQYVFLHQCIMDCLQPNEMTEENIYENEDMIYVNATALRELRQQ